MRSPETPGPSSKLPDVGGGGTQSRCWGSDWTTVYISEGLGLVWVLSRDRRSRLSSQHWEVQGQPLLHPQFKADLASKEVGRLVGGWEGSPRRGENPESSLPGREEQSQAPCWPCLLEGVWESWAAGEALPARPARPAPRWQPANPKRGRAPCQGGRGARPAQAGSCQPRWCPCARHGRTRFPPMATGTGWRPRQEGGGGAALPLSALGWREAG